MPVQKSLETLIVKITETLALAAVGEIDLQPDNANPKEKRRWAPLYSPDVRPAFPAQLHSYTGTSLAKYLNLNAAGEQRNLEVALLLLQLREQEKISEATFNLIVSGESAMSIRALLELAKAL